jgi:signal transduction histidine kinase
MNWINRTVLTATSDLVHPAPERNSAASRIAPPSAEVWMVFGMRLLLAITALLTLYIGSGGVVLAGAWSWLIFVAYALHSLVLLGMAHYRAGFWHGPVMYWVDLGWYGMMVWASGGSTSPFFAFYFFAILAASFRHGFDAGARLTLGAAIVVTIAVLTGRSPFVVHLLLLRATFVLALGYMIAFWGGLAVEQRRRLALLRDVSRLSNPRFGVQHTLDSLMEKILRFYGGATCVLLTQDGDDWMLTTVAHPDSGGPISRSRVDADAVQPLLDLNAASTVLYRGARVLLPGAEPAVQLAPGAKAWTALVPDGCAAIADLLDARSFIAAPLPLRKGAGRIFVTADARLRRNDASFLTHIAQQAFPVIETIELLDRLASDAAFRERQTIARDLHDSTIQPYIGLRHAVAAIRNQAGAGNPVAPELDRLVDMCSDVVTDMRRFAHSFKSGRQQEPELLVALRRQLDKVRTFYDVDATLEMRGSPAINDRMAAQVFQVVSEGVNNICKHTHAKSAAVTLAEEGGQLAIDIANPPDGKGVPDSFLPVSIAERVQELGGTLAVEATERGTLLRIRVPV